MPNGIWDRETYMSAQDRTKDAMTFDMLKSINDQVGEIRKQPEICAVIMDNKIKVERKLRRKINLGIGGGGGIGVVAVFEFIRSFWPK